MKKIEQLILEYGNIETLCCYMEAHFEELSDEMKIALSSWRDRLSAKLGPKTDPYESIYDLPLADFFRTYRKNDYYNRDSVTTRATNVLKKHSFETLRSVLKVPRSELQKINGFGKHSCSFHCFKDTMENAGIDPYLVLK